MVQGCLNLLFNIGWLLPFAKIARALRLLNCSCGTGHQDLVTRRVIWLFLMLGVLTALFAYLQTAPIQHRLLMLCARDSVRRALLADPLSSTPRPRVAVVIPFIDADTARIEEALGKWERIACAASSDGAYGLFFYNSGVFSVHSSRMETHAHKSSFARCFGEIRTLYAALRPEDDGYPEGPSLMFFKMFALTALAPYSHALWMEWDTLPVRVGWLDALVTEAGREPRSWMVGSRYTGTAFDASVMQPSSHVWVGHLNGNALYTLHNAEFARFRELVLEREPPGHFWRPFDIAIWQTMHALPYTWRLYQVHGDRLRAAPFLANVGFTTTPDAVAAALADPRVVLIHGHPDSAGRSGYQRKFKGGLPVSNATVYWGDVLTPTSRLSVMMRACAEDMAFAAVAMEAAGRAVPHALEFVAVVPSADVAVARRAMPAWVIIKSDELPPDDSHVAQRFTTLSADNYTRGDFVLHIDSDVILTRRLLNRDLWFQSKPMVYYESCANVKVRNKLTISCRTGISHAIGANVMYEFSSSVDHVYSRSIYAEVRAHVEKVHGKPLIDFLRRQLKSLLNATQQPQESILNAYDVIGAYLYHMKPETISWMCLGGECGPHATAHEYTVMRPELTCRGNARFPSTEQMRLFRAVAAGSLACASLHAHASKLS